MRTILLLSLILFLNACGASYFFRPLCGRGHGNDGLIEIMSEDWKLDGFLSTPNPGEKGTWVFQVVPISTSSTPKPFAYRFEPPAALADHQFSILCGIDWNRSASEPVFGEFGEPEPEPIVDPDVLAKAKVDYNIPDNPMLFPKAQRGGFMGFTTANPTEPIRCSVFDLGP